MCGWGSQARSPPGLCTNIQHPARRCQRGLQIMMRSAAHVLYEHLRSSLTQIHHSQPRLHMTISENFICNIQQPSSGAVYPYSVRCKQCSSPKWQCVKPTRPNGSICCHQPRVLKVSRHPRLPFSAFVPS